MCIRDRRQDVIGAPFVGLDAGLGLHRKISDLTRQTACRRRLRWSLAVQAVGEFVLDVGNHLTVAVLLGDIEQDKTVERIAVGRRVNLGVDDAVAGTREEGDDADEQIGPVSYTHLDVYKRQALYRRLEGGALDGARIRRAYQGLKGVVPTLVSLLAARKG